MGLSAPSTHFQQLFGYENMASSTDDASSAYASDASSSPPSSHQDLSVPTRPERSRFAVNSAPPASNDALAKTLTRERRRSVLQSNSYKAPPPAPDTNEIWARYVTPTYTRLKRPNVLAHSPCSLDHSPLFSWFAGLRPPHSPHLQIQRRLKPLPPYERLTMLHLSLRPHVNTVYTCESSSTTVSLLCRH